MKNKTLTTMVLAGTLIFGQNTKVYAQEPTQQENSEKEKPKEENTDDFRKTSLLEATIYTGLPALTITAAVFTGVNLKEKRSANDILDGFAWGFKHPPVWDNNPWYINYVGHPEFGAEAYLLARNRNHSPFVSFLYSTLASVTWEYAIEPWEGARPSRQDLLITSTTGSLIGELRYQGKKALMKNEDNTLNKVGIILLDPFDAIYKAFE